MAESSIALIVGSTGAPGALRELMDAMAPRGRCMTWSMPVIVALHMPESASRRLAMTLEGAGGGRASLLPLATRVQTGSLYVVAGGTHVAFESPYLCEPRDDYEGSYLPSLDLLLESAAAWHGDGLTVVVLSGLAGDGLAGARAVRAGGGRLLVQDRATAVAWGMPGAIVRAGLAGAIASPRGLGLMLAQVVGRRAPTLGAA